MRHSCVVDAPAAALSSSRSSMMAGTSLRPLRQQQQRLAPALALSRPLAAQLPAGAGFSGRQQPCSSSSSRRRAVAARGLSQLDSAHGSVGSSSNGSGPSSSGSGLPPSLPAPTEQHIVVAPEDFQLAPGQLSLVNRGTPFHPDDAFHCAGCELPQCRGPTGCAAMQWRNQAAGYLREILTAKVYDVAIETPLEKMTKLSARSGNAIMLKREDLQPVKSFKLRGAYNKMAQLTPEQLERGVITSSAGNHAQGVALSAARMGCDAVICMPITTPTIKVQAVREKGATVQLVGESYNETQTAAMERARTEGRVFIPPYDDPYVIAGQGTIGMEILRQTDMHSLDAIFVAVGGGGLAAGVAAYVKALRPEVKVIGVEPTGANAMTQSLAYGRRVELSKVDSFADGVAVKWIGAESFRLCRELLDGCVLVDNSAISAAIKDVFEETRSILEPAGAAAVAGAKAYLQHYGLKGQQVVAVTSGANMNFDRLRLVSELADVGTHETMLAISIPERPGSFLQLVEAALNGTDLNVTEMKYRYSANATANVLLSVGMAPGSEECKGVVQRLEDQAFSTIDISDLEIAQIHLRHLVGGRGAGAQGDIPHERIFQVDFPERPGALKDFLPAFSSRWNVTLFHYRKSGNRYTGVLLGMQVPEEDGGDFAAAAASLKDFTFSEIGGKARQVFQMFM